MNVTALMGTDGTVLERYVYDPYGKVTIYDDDWSDTRGTSSYDNNILFCGYYHDWETGLYHVRNRYYHEQLGWITRDPAGYVDGMSLYQYCGSRATAAVDPMGLGLMYVRYVSGYPAQATVEKKKPEEAGAEPEEPLPWKRGGAGPGGGGGGAGGVPGGGNGVPGGGGGVVVGGGGGDWREYLAAAGEHGLAFAKGIGDSVMGTLGYFADTGLLVADDARMIGGLARYYATGEAPGSPELWSETGRSIDKTGAPAWANQLEKGYREGGASGVAHEALLMTPVVGTTARSIENAVEKGAWTPENTRLIGNSVGQAAQIYAVKKLNNALAPKTLNPIQGLQRTGSALKTDPYHAFPDVVDNFASSATKTQLQSGAALYQVEGSLNGAAGRFEWVVEDANVTHRMFVGSGTINGVPTKP